MQPSQTKTGFAKKLHAALKTRELSVRAASLMTGFSEDTIRSWLCGRRRPTWHCVQVIANSLGIMYSELEHAGSPQNIHQSN